MVRLSRSVAPGYGEKQAFGQTRICISKKSRPQNAPARAASLRMPLTLTIVPDLPVVRILRVVADDPVPTVVLAPTGSINDPRLSSDEQR